MSRLLSPATKLLRLLGGLLIAAAVVLSARSTWASIRIGAGNASIPYVEAIDAVGRTGLPSEKRTRIIKGALDAFDREGSIIVRSLAARLLSLAALHDPTSIVPELKRRAEAWQSLLVEAGPDHAAASLAFAAQAAWFMVDPGTAPRG
jgi:hypothetical protein